MALSLGTKVKKKAIGKFIVLKMKQKTLFLN
jgi:hypothetical protein